MQRSRAALAAALLALSFIVPMSASGDTTVQSGCHPVTDQERAAIQAMGSTIPASGQFCDNDKALMYGGCDESPYPFLQTKNKSGRPDTISGLNSDFACRLSKFIKRGDDLGRKITITSGYRSVALQKQLYDKYVACGKCGAPVAPPGSSKHNFGLAADLLFDGVWPNYGLGAGNTPKCVATLPSCKWAHENEAASGLRYPMVVEPWHIEPSGTVNGMQQPLPQGGWTGDDSTTPYTNTGAPYNPSTWTPSMAPSPAQFSPLAALSPQQQPTIPTTPTYPTYPTDTQTYPWPTGTSTIFVVPPPYTFGPSTTTSGSTTTKELTAYEQIQLYNQSYEWNPVTPHSPSTASSSVQINTDLSSTTNQSDADGISNTSNSAYDVNKPIATTSVDVSPIHVTETFTQNGVAQIGGTSGPSQINTGQSVIVRLLTNLRDVLLIFLQILRSRPTYGYEAPWAPKGAASVYR